MIPYEYHCWPRQVGEAWTIELRMARYKRAVNGKNALIVDQSLGNRDNRLAGMVIVHKWRVNMKLFFHYCAAKADPADHSLPNKPH